MTMGWQKENYTFHKLTLMTSVFFFPHLTSQQIYMQSLYRYIFLYDSTSGYIRRNA